MSFNLDSLIYTGLHKELSEVTATLSCSPCLDSFLGFFFLIEEQVNIAVTSLSSFCKP